MAEAITLGNFAEISRKVKKIAQRQKFSIKSYIDSIADSFSENIIEE